MTHIEMIVCINSPNISAGEAEHDGTSPEGEAGRAGRKRKNKNRKGI